MSAPNAGDVQTIAPGLRCILAPNPGPMTHWGTNTFILGEGRVAIVDPGPDDGAHLQALIKATSGETITHILVTHAHRDHSPLARALSAVTGAPVIGFGPADAGRSATMARLAKAGLAGGGEGVDTAFQPDITVNDGDQIVGDDWTVDVVHTPGHFAGHLAFSCADGVISGDHVMDWSSSLVSPPDGDIGAFMATSAKLRAMNAARLFPGHGSPIEDPAERLDWLTAHRLSRETAIRHVLDHTPQSITSITAKVYTDVPPAMLPAAARNVFAHLIDLVERNIASVTPELSPKALFAQS
ncbi:MBL fold metallo-hydrolase [bacterium]|nr:MBL fold metallo-hydrolase [bacterium]